MRSLHALGVSLVAVGLSIFGCSKSSDYGPVGPGSGEGGTIDAAVDAAPVDATVGDAADAANGNAPPEIALIAPAAPYLVAGVIQIDLQISDAEGVASVTATIGGASHPITLAPGQVGHLVGQFDTAVLAGVVSPNILVTVVDQVGASGQRGFPITLDNSSPIASMDPPKVRMYNATDMTCSDSFDPLGGDAPNDRETVAQLSEFRARVEDRPNTGTLNKDTTVFIPLAGVASVKLNVLHSTGAPLVVDSNADHTCDRINPNVAPVVITLAQTSPGGAAFFGPTTFAGSNSLLCKLGTATMAPAPLCDGEQQATIAISTPFKHLPSIFGIPQVDSDNCLGYVFDALADNVPDGWACVAVETTDAVGNRNVSAPIRVCINSANNPASPCGPVGTTTPANSAAVPNCTGTLDASGTVTATACTPETFFDSGIVNDYELIRQ